MKRCEQIFMKAYYSTENFDYTRVDGRNIALKNIQSDLVSVWDKDTEELLMYVKFRTEKRHEIVIINKWASEPVQDVIFQTIGG
jgi:hypothetical protein